MKKKVKRAVIPKQGTPGKPPKVGGRGTASGKVNWSKVGRRRLEQNDGIQELAKTLKALREEQAQTITQVANHLKVAPATLIKFEDRGHPISVKIVLALAAHLGCTLEVKPVTKSRKKK